MSRSVSTSRTKEKDIIPRDYYCPITHEVMQDPVVTADGQSYERSAIQQWFDMGHRTSPATNARLPHMTLTPNRILKSLIQAHTEQTTKLQKRDQYIIIWLIQRVNNFLLESRPCHKLTEFLTLQKETERPKGIAVRITEVVAISELILGAMGTKNSMEIMSLTKSFLTSTAGNFTYNALQMKKVNETNSELTRQFVHCFMLYTLYGSSAVFMYLALLWLNHQQQVILPSTARHMSLLISVAMTFFTGDSNSSCLNLAAQMLCSIFGSSSLGEEVGKRTAFLFFTPQITSEIPVRNDSITAESERPLVRH